MCWRGWVSLCQLSWEGEWCSMFAEPSPMTGTAIFHLRHLKYHSILLKDCDRRHQSSNTFNSSFILSTCGCRSRHSNFMYWYPTFLWHSYILCFAFANELHSTMRIREMEKLCVFNSVSWYSMGHLPFFVCRATGKYHKGRLRCLHDGRLIGEITNKCIIIITVSYNKHLDIQFCNFYFVWWKVIKLRFWLHEYFTHRLWRGRVVQLLC
jgi:hypothetical protein